jgi:hypothetical protein
MTAGAVQGYLQDTNLRQGQSGPLVPQVTYQYFHHIPAANVPAVNPVANSVVYRLANGQGGETTSYTYGWFPGTAQMQSQTVSRPVVSAAQNGPGTADVTQTYFDKYGRPIWAMDADGFLNYTAYDQATGAVVKTITDVNTNNTADFSNLPPMWVTPAGGGLHLITQTAVDPLGRATKVTDPNGNVTYRTYNDPNHESRTYHWDVNAQPAPTRIGPTEVTRTDRPGGYTETLTTNDAPVVVNGAPNGTE